HMEDPTNLMMVTGVLVFEKPLDYDRVSALLGDRLLGIPRFTQRVVEPRLPFAGPRWETDPHFDLRSHLHRVALRPPGDAASLRELVSDLMSTPLDFSKPLWQYHLIEGFGGGCALLCRLHHSIGDGIALIRVLLSMADGTGDAGEAADPPEPHGWERLGPLLRPAARMISRTIEVGETLMHEGAETLAHPERLLELASRGATGVDTLANLLLMEPDPESPFKGSLGVAERAAWSAPIPLEEVKAAGRALGATVNDVLLTAVTGALRRYLDSRGAPSAGLDFRAVVPVNLRRKEEENDLGNRFGLVFLSLPVGIENPVERLFELKERMDEIKRSPEAVVAFGLLGAIGSAPAEVEHLVVDLFGRRGTAVMTNVAGPREPISLAGVPVKEVMFWVPQSGRLGLGVSILSYAGGVSLGVATDVGLVPDPDAILEGFGDEFSALAALAQREAAARPSARSQPAPRSAKRVRAATTSKTGKTAKTPRAS
ncbi:MAG TPA: wax ester/triacylglycerol synthase family O-acyltransferase, partial [Thermoanaerobaculia bacterium]|nr:wax ester/triacylglycerol synthase family O-acyltransferase [Thermoanaerobaculia bacterium]